MRAFQVEGKGMLESLEQICTFSHLLWLVCFPWAQSGWDHSHFVYVRGGVNVLKCASLTLAARGFWRQCMLLPTTSSLSSPSHLDLAAFSLCRRKANATLPPPSFQPLLLPFCPSSFISSRQQHQQFSSSSTSLCLLACQPSFPVFAAVVTFNHHKFLRANFLLSVAAWATHPIFGFF